jgi:hypothetical protein
MRRVPLNWKMIIQFSEEKEMLIIMYGQIHNFYGPLCSIVN